MKIRLNYRELCILFARHYQEQKASDSYLKGLVHGNYRVEIYIRLLALIRDSWNPTRKLAALRFWCSALTFV